MITKKGRIFSIYRTLFAKRRFYKLNRSLFALSLRGLGLFNFGDDLVTGEDYFLRNILADILRELENPVIFDVGANEGSYASKVKEIFPKSTIYAFEPHPKTFERLQTKAETIGFQAINLALGEKHGQMQLYDYANAALTGTSHASFYKDVIEKIRQSQTITWDVNIVTLDDFVSKRKIKKVNLLKIDTEGHELNVLVGGRDVFEKGVIDIIQFEFNEMNIFSRTFFRDIYELLPNYCFFRMLQDGLIPLGEYTPLRFELFGYQNIVAVPQNMCNEKLPIFSEILN